MSEVAAVTAPSGAPGDRVDPGRGGTSGDRYVPSHLFFLASLVTGLVAWFGVLHNDPQTGLSESWGPLPAMFLAMASLWDATGGLRKWRYWAGVAFVEGLFALGCVIAGLDLLPALWCVFIEGSMCLLGLIIYRRYRPEGSWAPQTPVAVFTLLGVCFSAAALTAVFNGFPVTAPVPYGPRLIVWWTISGTANLWIGVLAFFMLWYWRRDPLLPRAHPGWPVLIVVGVAAVVIIYALPDLPLGWLVIVPAAAAGMMLPPPQAALFSITVSCAQAVMLLSLHSRFSFEGFITPSAVLQIVFMFTAFVPVLLAVFRDEQARLEHDVEVEAQAASRTAELLSAVFESMNDGLILADLRGRITWHNPAVRTLLGRPIVPLTDSWADYFQVHTPDGSRRLSDRELPLRPDREPGGVARGEYSVPTADGGRRIISVTTRLVTTPQGPRVLVLCHDVTAEHARYRELRGFAGTVAHDLKGPLTALSGWIEMADDQLADDDAVAGRMALAKARQAGVRMRQLVDDYLAFTVSREGLLRLGEVRLADVVTEVTEIYTQDDLERSPQFDVDVRHVSRADRSLTRQLLANLIGNAVKYSRPGEPAQVRVSSVDDVEPGWVQVQVADRGVGIAPGDEERIFGQFTRSEKDADTFAGTGLGLALCHAIVTRHGGQISAESNEFGGATFRFTLPCSAGVTPAGGAESTGRGMRRLSMAHGRQPETVAG